MNLKPPKRIALANIPTPLMSLERTSAALGVEFYVKRDDMTGIELSGNKVRKLEFLLADAIDQGCDVVITGGGEQSNHCRATALACTQLGLRSVICLRTDDKDNPPKTSGNILLDRLSGAEIVWIDHDDWARQHDIYEEQATRLRATGKNPYIIPEGGSNGIGAWGYIECCRELALQLSQLPIRDTTIIYACGSGGTGAGLIVGAKLYELEKYNAKIAGFNVCDDRDYFVEKILNICDQVATDHPLTPRISELDIDIIDGYVGRGYAKSSPEELECLRDMAQREAIIFDPVYSGKAFYGTVSELAKNVSCFGERVVFVHTGGIFGIFPEAESFTWET